MKPAIVKYKGKTTIEGGGVIHIRQILHRASLLIILFAAVAAMVALCFTTVAQFYVMEAVDPDFLSDNSVKVEIHQSNEGEPLVQTRDLLEYLSAQGGSLIVYRSFPIANGKAVFLSGDTVFKPEIIEGRSFSKDDFKQQAAVALIDERIRHWARGLSFLFVPISMVLMILLL